MHYILGEALRTSAPSAVKFCSNRRGRKGYAESSQKENIAKPTISCCTELHGLSGIQSVAIRVIRGKVVLPKICPADYRIRGK